MNKLIFYIFLLIEISNIYSQSPDTLYPAQVFTDSGYKYGYINNQGYLSIKPQYAFAKDFSEGFAFVKNEIDSDKWICINTSGLDVFELKAMYVKDFSNGAARYLDSAKKLYAVGFSGELITNPLEEKPIYCGQWTRYSIDGRYGFFNVYTYDSLPAVYFRAGNFCQGPAPVFIMFNESDLPSDNCYNAFINEKGAVIIKAELKYDDKGFLESGYFYSPERWKNGVCRYYTSNDPITKVEKYIRSDGKVIW